MNVNSKLPLCRVYDEPESVSAVANTITLSFAQDPLIKWLRPLAPTWARDQFATYKWQYRRIQSMIAQGIVLQSVPALKDHWQLFLPEGSKSNDIATPLSDTITSECGGADHDAGVGLLLLPPPRRLNWTLSRLILTCKLWLLDIFDPVPEEGTNMVRLERLMAIHQDAMARIKKQYKVQDLWYLEVVAVHPTLQGRGLGKKAMIAVLDFIQDEAITLECTSENTIGFYQSLGFEVAEEVELIDGDEAVKIWFMLRQTSNTTGTH
ncbi:GNAT family N-acetyltransferase [Aspergillus granulosus]|uniref:GNAT family N-acetyltransferase n=1 Tax=Aspergillus granulosus TaxID=176169 RepID=A0ABR4GYK6_9EURO